jgi:hypothetical protein
MSMGSNESSKLLTLCSIAKPIDLDTEPRSNFPAVCNRFNKYYTLLNLESIWPKERLPNKLCNLVNTGISRDPNNLNDDVLKDISHATPLKKARFHKNSCCKGLVHLRYGKALKQFIQITVSAMWQSTYKGD